MFVNEYKANKGNTEKRESNVAKNFFIFGSLHYTLFSFPVIIENAI